MKLKIDDIEAFCTVADCGSFKEAANALNITPSALSRRLVKLEDALGARLLDRTTRRVSVSTVGEEFLPEARRIIGAFQKSIEEMRDLISVRAGAVSIATNMTISDTILPRIVRQFRRQNPRVRISVTESSSPQALERVLNHECEFAVAQFGAGHPDLAFEPLLDDYFVLVCHPDHPLAARKRITWADLDRHNFIRLRASSGTSGILERTLGAKTRHLSGDITIGHFSALLGLVGENLGVSVIPSLVVLKCAELGLATRPIKAPVVSRKLGIVTKRGKSLSPASQALAVVCRSLIQQSSRG